METWILLGILAALSFGISAAAAKMATSPSHYGMSLATASVLMLIGIALVVGAYAVFQGGLKMPSDPAVLGVGISIGLFWALGEVLVFLALTGNADISKLAPIYNMNTLVTVLLGIALLHELPSQPQLVRVVIGAVLIVIGGILVSV
jgi:uncharacterized membrane protein